MGIRVWMLLLVLFFALAANLELSASASSASTSASTSAFEASTAKVDVEERFRPICCDHCGTCTRSIPPLCTCNDVLLRCPRWCQNCVRALIAIFPPRYVCKDRKPNYCRIKCTAK
ncbi:Bowman-Birk type trypsin inhibitor [Apostasia shenzhenica]|uniref:Bowman-Birk type trypsin inhibitor n=1 Tax=Apostasia shenzhenica TaxID=1088818 RepID=A0A2I0AYN2_9ASPA|nr:Bowman-Birk type trypsin inhibitor [Apostasia shenzhenica]